MSIALGSPRGARLLVMGATGYTGQVSTHKLMSSFLTAIFSAKKMP